MTDRFPFRQLEEFPKYELNRIGELRNINSGVLLKLHTDSGQYYLIRKNRKYRKRSVRNLIAKTFPPAPPIENPTIRAVALVAEGIGLGHITVEGDKE